MSHKKFYKLIKKVDCHSSSPYVALTTIHLPPETFNWLEIIRDETDITGHKVLNASVALGGLHMLAVKYGLQSFVVDRQAKRFYDVPDCSQPYTPDTINDDSVSFRLTMKNRVMGNILQKECSVALDTVVDDGLRIVNTFAAKSPDAYFSVQGYRQSRRGELVSEASCNINLAFDLSRVPPSPDI